MAKRKTAEKVMKKLVTTGEAAAPSKQGVSIIIDRRKALPQPNFKHYREAGAYPGGSFFFVGHSYNVEHKCCGGQFKLKRQNAIKNVLELASKHHTVAIKDALQNPEFFSVLSRFERDWLGRLPDTSLIGPAIDQEGTYIAHSFTVWRKERRITNSKTKETEKAIAASC